MEGNQGSTLTLSCFPVDRALSLQLFHSLPKSKWKQKYKGFKSHVDGDCVTGGFITINQNNTFNLLKVFFCQQNFLKNGTYLKYILFCNVGCCFSLCNVPSYSYANIPTVILNHPEYTKTEYQKFSVWKQLLFKLRGALLLNSKDRGVLVIVVGLRLTV